MGEEVRMELKFLYAVDSEEAQDAITASNQQYHVGLGEYLPSHSVLLHISKSFHFLSQLKPT